MEFLADFRGALQTDGYVVYDIFDTHTQITTYGCWSHARRYFFKARATQKVWAAFVLKRIRQLYAVERTLKGCTPSECYRVRQAKSVPILQELKRWLDTHAGAGLPKSPWRKAVHYTLARWDKLTRFVHDGRMEIDNNRIENSIRPIALGRKNYLFAGSHDAAQRAAVIYSLSGTCKQHNINPEVWLSDVLRRIPTHPQEEIHELLPHRWQAPTDEVPP